MFDREIYIFYYVPVGFIGIAAILLILGVFGQIAAVIGTVIKILWFLIGIWTLISVIGCFFICETFGQKIMCSIISVGANVATMYESQGFFSQLTSTAADSGLFGIISFGFTLIYGGCLWLTCALTNITALGLALDDTEG